MSLINCQGDPGQNVSWLFTEWAFNQCVQHTFLLWLPCSVFWLLIPCELMQLRRLSNQSEKWKKIDGIRVVSMIFLILLILGLLTSATIQVQGSSRWRWIIAFSFGALLVTFVTCLYLIIAQQRKRVAGSRAASLMLFTALVAGLFEFASSCAVLSRKRDSAVDSVVPALFIVYYLNIIVAIIAVSISSVKPPFLEEESTEQSPWPEEYCSFASQLFYSWFTKLLWSGYKRALELRDVWFVSHAEQTNVVYAKFGPHYQQEYGPVVYSKRFGTFAKPKQEVEIRRMVKRPSLSRVILKTCGWSALEAGLLKLVNDVLVFVEPFVVKLMIAFYDDHSIPTWHGFVYVTLIGISMTTKSAALNQYFNIMMRLGVQVRTALVSAIYRKSLRLTSESRSSWTTGEIVNLMSVDASRFRESAAYVQLIWSAPLQIIVGLAFLYTAVGHAVWAGIGFLVAVVLANGIACKVYEKLTERQMNEKDKRMKLLTEILNGIKVIKLYAWEPAFRREVETIRSKELRHIRCASYVGGMMEFAWMCTTIFSCLIIFGTYLAMSSSNKLTAEMVFFVISVFHIIEFPLAMIPHLIADLIMLSVSVKRLSSFFSAQELNEGQVMKSNTKNAVAVKVSRGTFAWESNAEQESPLQEIDFEVQRGQLCAIVGQVGAGKSSLLSAICGEMHKVNGIVQIDGSVAYVAQQPWIQNATLRDNVLFGRKYDKSRYDEVIRASALEPDIAMLSSGEMTEIGERGVNLSGGQKQRLSFARAVYQDQDIYLMDDPLSAVDVYVGRHLFDNLIGPNGLLKEKTRILVTHDLSYLNKCHTILVMSNGRICEKGGYRQLMDRKGALANLVREFKANQRAGLEKKVELSASEILEEIPFRRSESSSPKSSKWRSSDNVQETSKEIVVKRAHSQTSADLRKKSPPHMLKSNSVEKEQAAKETPGLTSEEVMQVGKVSWSIYLSYARASGFGILMYLLFLFVAQSCNFLSTIWLQKWTDTISDSSANGSGPTKNGTEISDSKGLTYFGLCAAGQVLFTAFAVVFFAYFQVNAAKRIHSNLLYSILRAPLAFFHATPTGRIINRCGKDINTVDNEIPSAFDQVAHCSMIVLEALIGIIYATPFYVVAVIPLLFLYYLAQRFYVKTSRQLRRLEAVTRSPVFSHFQETLQGVATIRAFEREEEFIERCSRLVDVNSSAQIALITSNRWVGIRLEVIGSGLVSAATFVIVLMRDQGLSPGLVGLSVSFALTLTGLLSWGVQQTSVLETEIVAIERINEYTNTPSEAEWNSRKALAKWPLWGGIQFKNYSIKYRPDLTPVLKSLTLSIEPGHKIGVIGRTGAGKTSLTLGLFRLVEAFGGRILIDDIDIASIGLHDLRRKLTIIPQDPVLFTGSLRFNIDPFVEYSDTALWSTLELSQLKPFVSALPAKLDHEVTEGGSNLSVGQRQLICLARALLRKSKIIVLDEATAAVDTETDALVQQTVRTHFRDCTVIIIAHRLNSVRECNKILVLDNGMVVEYDNPEALLQRPDSYYKMITDAHAGQFSHSASGP